MNSTEQDLKVRKGPAWQALDGMESKWSAGLSRDVKLSFFFATDPTFQAIKALDRCYTQMLASAYNTTSLTESCTGRFRGQRQDCKKKDGVSWSPLSAGRVTSEQASAVGTSARAAREKQA